MKKEPTVFKVVKLRNRKLYSAWMNKAGVQLQYKVKRWTYPIIPQSPLIAFDCYDNAFKWAELIVSEPYRIYICKAKNVRTPPETFKWNSSYMFVTLEFATFFWDHVSQGMTVNYTRNNPPAGTVFCDAIYLSKSIYRKD